MGARGGRLEVGDVPVEPRLRPAELAARRPRAAAHQGPATRPTGRRRASTSSTATSGGRTRSPQTEAPGFQLGDLPQAARWRQEIKVSVRNLRTPTFVTAGFTVGQPHRASRASAASRPAWPASWPSSRSLRRGDTYTLKVYSPNPNGRQLAATPAPLRAVAGRVPRHPRARRARARDPRPAHRAARARAARRRVPRVRRAASAPEGSRRGPGARVEPAVPALRAQRPVALLAARAAAQARRRRRRSRS